MNENIYLKEMSLEDSSDNLAIHFSKRGDYHLARKLWHTTPGVLGFAAYYILGLSIREVASFALIVAGLSFSLEMLRFKSKKVNYHFCRLGKHFLRGSEVHKFSGLPFYALGVGLSLLLFPKNFALLSIMFLVVADPMSSLVGSAYGREKFLPNKSIEGTLTCFLVCYTLSFFYLKAIGASGNDLFYFSIFAGMIGAFSELMSAFKIDDNLTIPVISGLGLTLLNSILPII
ncbi:MAG: hypothetical protein H6621_11970 [Halobacteriovoraceae bacterium]|nr:hypothetical protein [Halobacteriovoraceae bacterium]MCB9095778.1 hypothetical protein [Halobacteriovoraceae bacterium]